MERFSIRLCVPKLIEFVKIIGSEFPEDRLTYQKGIATFHPEATDEASRFITLANKHRQKLFITGFGNNINPVGEKFENIIAVRTDRLNSIQKIVPEDFYIIVGAGYPLKELNLHLQEFGLFQPHSDLPYVGSIGGALAVGLAARWDKHPLPLGRYFIKAEIVTPTGEIITPGSICFKSVSGFDIVKVFSPSWGLLGLITFATLRVLPTTVRDEYKDIKLLPIEYGRFAGLYINPRDNVSAQYSIKIKNKFDPNHIFPLITP
jgi:FAD/FMN-containing dehydrogenase